jgi:pyruvate dehydrogenase E2 component (dihydrolipoamide acetyltransferase)
MSERIPTWRKVALVTWDAPRDPTAYGILELDCEAVLEHIESLREKTGEKVTLTHVVGRAAALAIAETPQVNAYVSRGRLVRRDTIDIFFQVSFFEGQTKKDANLAGAKVERADQKSVTDIARELREKAEALRARGDADTARAARTFSRLPAPLLKLATRAGAYLAYDMQMNMSRVGLPEDAFGTVMVTNIGVFGIPIGIAPLLPLGRAPIILTVGTVRDAPGVHEGKVAVRKRVAIGVAFDHRVLDGWHAGMMCKRFEAAFADPAGQLG